MCIVGRYKRSTFVPYFIQTTTVFDLFYNVFNEILRNVDTLSTLFIKSGLKVIRLKIRAYCVMIIIISKKIYNPVFFIFVYTKCNYLLLMHVKV